MKSSLCANVQLNSNNLDFPYALFPPGSSIMLFLMNRKWSDMCYVEYNDYDAPLVSYIEGVGITGFKSQYEAS